MSGRTESGSPSQESPLSALATAIAAGLACVAVVTILSPLSWLFAIAGAAAWYRGRSSGALLAAGGLSTGLVLLAAGSPSAVWEGARAAMAAAQAGDWLAVVMPWTMTGAAFGLTAAGFLLTMYELKPSGRFGRNIDRHREAARRRRMRAFARRVSQSTTMTGALGPLASPTQRKRHDRAIADELVRIRWRMCRARYTVPLAGWPLTFPVLARVLILTPDAMKLPGALAAASGFGKTETLKQLARMTTAAAHKGIFIDPKGTDPGLAGSYLGAFSDAWTGDRPPRVKHWPTQPMDMWRCKTAQELTSRLMAVLRYENAFYEAEAERILQLALGIPGWKLPKSSVAFLDLLDRELLRREYASDPRALRSLASISEDGWRGTVTRYEGFFASIGGLLDGNWSFEDADLIMISAPSLADQRNMSAALRVILGDLMHWAGSRKDRDEPYQIVVDELPAIKGGEPIAFDLVERGRDPGAYVSLVMQSLEGLSERDGLRFLQSCGRGVLLGRMPNPEPFMKLVGHDTTDVVTLGADDSGRMTRTSYAEAKRPRLDENGPRSAERGEAWHLADGFAEHVWVFRQATGGPGRAKALEAAREWAQTADDERLRWYVSRLAEAADDLEPARREPLRLPRVRVPAWMPGLPWGPGRELPMLPSPERAPERAPWPVLVPLAAVWGVLVRLAGRVRRGVRR